MMPMTNSRREYGYADRKTGMKVDTNTVERPSNGEGNPCKGKGK
jgi:hypothetical protein